jgi:hypothetical protein
MRTRGLLLLAALVMGMCLCPGRSYGEDKWIVPTGDWSDGNNWASGVPNSGSDAAVKNGGTATITKSGALCRILGVGAGGQWGTVSLVSGSITSYNGENIGDVGGLGYFFQSGGLNTIAPSRSLSLGLYGGSGTYQLAGPGVLTAPTEYVGLAGSTGAFTQTDGNNTVAGSLYLGNGASSSGTYQLSGTGRLTAGSLYLGNGASSSGTCQLSGSGFLTAGSVVIGNDGNGVFSQTGGLNSDGNVFIGSQGRYLLTGGTLQVSTSLVNNGLLDFGGGTAQVVLEANIMVVFAPGTLKGGESTSLYIGSNSLVVVPEGIDPGTEFGSISGPGTFYVVGTPLVIPAGSSLALNWAPDDPVECRGNLLLGTDVVNGLWVYPGGSVTSAAQLTVNDASSGQSGGTMSMGYIFVGVGTRYAGGQGIYRMQDGNLNISGAIFVGEMGTGVFTQSGGDNTIWYVDSTGQNDGVLALGGELGDLGTYQLSGTARLKAYMEVVGFGGTGTFLHMDGNNTVSTLMIGSDAGSSGSYQMSGGRLTAEYLYIGVDGQGSFCVTDANAHITVSSLLSVGALGSLSAVPGSIIHMTGSAFVNQSTDANLLAGMSNLRLIYEHRDPNGPDPFEVAGRDIGADANGFLHNFGLATLQLGGDGGPGQVLLVDLFKNQPDTDQPEALYVQGLIVNPGSELILDGLHLYVDGVLVNPGDGALYGGGDIDAVPEPATLTLLGVAGLTLLRRRGGRAGRTRPLGRLAAGVPLTQYDPNHPYIEAEYDLSERG